MTDFSLPPQLIPPLPPQESSQKRQRRPLLSLAVLFVFVSVLISTVPGVRSSPVGLISKREQQLSTQSESDPGQQSSLLGLLSSASSLIFDFDPSVPELDFTDWSCRVTEEHPYPVIVLHGLLAPHFVSWVNVSRHLRDSGYCVYQMKYGMIPGVDFVGGLLDIKESAKMLPDFIDKVLAASGAQQVDMVTHSEGGTVARWYLKYIAPKLAQEQEQPQQDQLWSEPKVRTLVSVGPVGDGTHLQGITTVMKVFGLYNGLNEWITQFCVPCTQLLDKSEFMLELYKDGEILVPGVRMLNIVTRHDQFVTPYTKGLIQLVPEDELMNKVFSSAAANTESTETEGEEQGGKNRLQNLVQLQQDMERSHLPQGLQTGDIQNLFAEDHCQNNTQVSNHIGLFRSAFAINATLQFLSPTFTGTFGQFTC